VLGGHGGDSPAPLTPAAGTHSLAATRQATAVAPSASAKTSYAVDPCLVGNWKDAGDVLNNTIHGQRAQFTGKGGGIEVSADGGVTEQFGPETLTATIDGNVWTEVLGGSAAMHATTSHGQMVLSDIAVSPDATQAVRERRLRQHRPDVGVDHPHALHLLAVHTAAVLVRRHLGIRPRDLTSRASVRQARDASAGGRTTPLQER
jgi:hypothetical protein